MSVHIVLAPGFAGFDALGQLEYYAGVTPLFRQWRNREPRTHVALRCFDNFPTAAVPTRAARLRSYLAKRIARGEFVAGDTVALVGHSTGGLDIRWLLRELPRSGEPIAVDGGAGVEPREILDLVNRVVFLSVPQWGTNLADWINTHEIARTVITAELRAVVAVSQAPLLDKLQNLIAGAAAWLTNSDLLLAVEDALSEADVDTCGNDPLRTASAQEAASELALWLRHMASDFSAIEDLTAEVPADGPKSPAHFSLEDRAGELANWNSHGIRTRSYATLGRRPFRFEPGKPAHRWDLINPFTYPEVSKAPDLSAGTDLVYRAAYRACAGGPFAYPTDPAFVPTATHLGSREQRHIEIWDNDGIVNTASMLWPNGPETLLVDGDHEDITGHFQRVEAIEGRGRRFQAYDLLKSGTDFRATFEQVWRGLFDFCL
jgi:triacylglycerol lipase